MKKNILIGGLLLVLVCLVGYNFFLGHQKEPTKTQAPPKTTQTEKTTTETTTDSTKKEETNSSTAEEVKEKKQATDLLKDFGHKWVNYKSIHERNQNVKPFFTTQAQKDNDLDNDPKAEFTSEGGEIDTISQSIEKPNHYVLLGTEKINKIPVRLILEVDLTNEQGTLLINKITVSYVRQAY